MLLVLPVIIVLQFCREPEPFTDEPRIEFNRLEFVRVQENGFQDSLILYFDFEDGDGDLGLEAWETFAPYQDYDVVVDANNRIVTLGDSLLEPPFRALEQRLNSISFYNLNDLSAIPAYSCEDYDTLRISRNPNAYIIPGTDFFIPIEESPIQIDDSAFSLDTVLIVKNEFRYNMFVAFEVDNNGEIETLDWEYITSPFGCGDNFNGRFAILDADNIGTSLQGTIKYSMLSLGFDLVLRTRPFQLKFHIVDRQLRKSNVVETGFMTLSDLIVQGQQNQE